jgi:methionyl-tRNA formyltransferase
VVKGDGLRLIFMGTPEFALPSLRKLVASDWEISLVVTQPDKPRGRGRKPTSPPVRLEAEKLGIRVIQPASLKDEDFVLFLKEQRADLIVVVAYGRILPPQVFRLPPFGTVNLHPSLLPKYRGAAPINWAIINGEKETGVTTILMDKGVDSGDILLSRRIEIGDEETAMELEPRLAEKGAELLLSTIEGLFNGTISFKPQDHSQATFAPMLKKGDGLIDWELPAKAIADRIRGFLPWPSAYSFFRGRLVKFLKGMVLPICESVPEKAPGEILIADGKRLIVVAGKGEGVEILRLKPEGKKEMDGSSFINGYRPRSGERFLPPA